MISQKDFVKKGMAWIAVIVAVVMLVIGLCFGRVIEGSLFAEIAKWVVMSIAVLVIVEGFAYFLLPLYWHFKIERKQEETPVQKMRREIQESVGLLEDTCASETCAYRGQGVCIIKRGDFCPLYVPKEK